MKSIILLIYLSAVNSSINPYTAISVAVNESALNIKAVGSRGDIGLFQVRHNLVPETKEQLLDPYKNIRAGIRVLEYSKKRCSNHKDDTWLVCYNRGVTGAKKVYNKKQDSYYLKVSRIKKCITKFRIRDLILKDIDLVKECKNDRTISGRIRKKN